MYYERFKIGEWIGKMRGVAEKNVENHMEKDYENINFLVDAKVFFWQKIKFTTCKSQIEFLSVSAGFSSKDFLKL